MWFGHLKALISTTHVCGYITADYGGFGSALSVQPKIMIRLKNNICMS